MNKLSLEQQFCKSDVIIPKLCEKTGALAIVEPSLTAGRPLDRQNCCKVSSVYLTFKIRIRQIFSVDKVVPVDVLLVFDFFRQICVITLLFILVRILQEPHISLCLSLLLTTTVPNKTVVFKLKFLLCSVNMQPSHHYTLLCVCPLTFITKALHLATNAYFGMLVFTMRLLLKGGGHGKNNSN